MFNEWGSYVLHNFPFYSKVRYKDNLLKPQTRFIFVTKSLHDMQESDDLKKYAAYQPGGVYSNAVADQFGIHTKLGAY